MCSTLLPNATAGAPVIVNIQNADYVNLSAQGAVATGGHQLHAEGWFGNVGPAVIIANSAITGGSGVTVHSDAESGVGFVELIATSPLTSEGYLQRHVLGAAEDWWHPAGESWSFMVQ